MQSFPTIPNTPDLHVLCFLGKDLSHFDVPLGIRLLQERKINVLLIGAGSHRLSLPSRHEASKRASCSCSNDTVRPNVG